MDGVRRALGLPVAVAFPGRVVVLGADPYLQGLDGRSPGDFRNAVARIRTMRSGVFEALATRPPDRRAIGDAVEAAYRDVPRIHPSLLSRLRDAVARALGSAVRNLVQFRGWKTIIEWAFVLAVAFVLVRTLARGRLVPDRAVPEGRVVTRGRARVDDWNRLAEEALARGEVEAAVRALYRGMLATLAARGIVGDDPTLTAGECRLAVGSRRPAILSAVAEATGAFERVAYGEEPGGMSDVEALRRAEGAVRAA